MVNPILFFIIIIVLLIIIILFLYAYREGIEIW